MNADNGAGGGWREATQKREGTSLQPSGLIRARMRSRVCEKPHTGRRISTVSFRIMKQSSKEVQPPVRFLTCPETERSPDEAVPVSPQQLDSQKTRGRLSVSSIHRQARIISSSLDSPSSPPSSLVPVQTGCREDQEAPLSSSSPDLSAVRLVAFFALSDVSVCSHAPAPPPAFQRSPPLSLSFCRGGQSGASRRQRLRSQ